MQISVRASRPAMVVAGILCSVASTAAGQAPGTDIFLVPLRREGTRLVLGNPENITDRPGYDNQPAFTSDGRAMLYTRIGNDGQADIYRVDLATRTTTGLIRTPESEYSAAMPPGGTAITVVRVEQDSTQRLWRFASDGSHPEVLFPALQPVGYYAWADAQRLIMFVLGSPPSLVAGNVETGRADTLARNVGRSMHKIPGRTTLSYVQRDSVDGDWIMELDLSTGRATRLTHVVGRGQDYTWTPEGVVLMASGNRLFAWRQGGGDWELVGALDGAGLSTITRLAVSPDGRWLAVVAAEAPRP